MARLVIPDLDPGTLAQLSQRASQHGCSIETEAKNILEHAATSPPDSVWDPADAIHKQLAASGRQFSDSAVLLREDRQR